ncbi:MAG: hypothetical protein RLZZ283_604 [Candidatus Parcubacteria bacterium]
MTVRALRGFAKHFLTLAIGVLALIGALFILVFVGMQFGWFNVRGSIAERNNFYTANAGGSLATTCAGATETWCSSAEWATVREGLKKDALIIARVAQETGVPARLIAAAVIPEQIRFFTAEREVYKRVFEPLKILGTMSQFSLGVSGIKLETAEEIERRTPEALHHLIVYREGEDKKAELYARLTNPKDHYFSYLYTALYIRAIEREWSDAGYPLYGEASIIATLFNIGFENSVPKATPGVGGAPIDIGGESVSFGALAGRFYDSDELVDIFPR